MHLGSGIWLPTVPLGNKNALAKKHGVGWYLEHILWDLTNQSWAQVFRVASVCKWNFDENMCSKVLCTVCVVFSLLHVELRWEDPASQSGPAHQKTCDLTSVDIFILVVMRLGAAICSSGCLCFFSTGILFRTQWTPTLRSKLQMQMRVRRPDCQDQYRLRNSFQCPFFDVRYCNGKQIIFHPD